MGKTFARWLIGELGIPNERGVPFGRTCRVLPIPLGGTEAYLVDGEGVEEAHRPRPRLSSFTTLFMS